jgi:hypothetical protein
MNRKCEFSRGFDQFHRSTETWKKSDCNNREYDKGDNLEENSKNKAFVKIDKLCRGNFHSQKAIQHRKLLKVCIFLTFYTSALRVLIHLVFVLLLVLFNELSRALVGRIWLTIVVGSRNLIWIFFYLNFWGRCVWFLIQRRLFPWLV